MKRLRLVRLSQKPAPAPPPPARPAGAAAAPDPAALGSPYRRIYTRQPTFGELRKKD